LGVDSQVARELEGSKIKAGAAVGQQIGKDLESLAGTEEEEKEEEAGGDRATTGPQHLSFLTPHA